MKLFSVLALIAAAAAFVPAATGTTARPQCTPVVKTVGGVRLTVWCGPATATARVAGKTHTFANGQCKKTMGAFTVNIGTTAHPPHAGYTYFGLLVEGTRPGTYTGKKVIVGFAIGTLQESLVAPDFTARPDTKVVIGPGGRSGRFSGKDVKGHPVTGSFHC